MVRGENGSIEGIFSERDYLQKVILKGFRSHLLTVEEAMTTKVITAKPDDTVADCLEKITKGRFRHLPVVDEKGLQGLVKMTIKFY